MAGSRQQAAQSAGGAVGTVSIIFPQTQPGETDRALVERIVRALYAHPDTRAAIEAAGGAAAAAPHYTTLSELGGRPPPAGVPALNAEIGVLEVPAPQPGGVQAVETAIAGIAPGVRVEEGTEYHALGDDAVPSPPRG